MVKHPRKKQKTSQHGEEIAVQPLGSNIELTDDASKDDEERRLESQLFGVPYVPRGDDKGNGPITIHDSQDDVAGLGKEMENLMDADLFYVDDGAPTVHSILEDITEDEDQGGSGSGSDHDETVSHAPQITTAPIAKSRKAPAWTDPSDTPLVVSLESTRLRKLRDAPTETTLTGREYETRLRRQYERINPQPAWAVKARTGKGKRRRDGADDGNDENMEPEDEEDDGEHAVEDIQDLLSSTTGILAPSRKSRTTATIPSGTLEIERLRDANQAAQASGCGEVKFITFHPSDKIPVLCVGSADRRIRLFNVDGHTSPLLQTLHIPSLPLTSTSGTFHPSGSHLLLTGPRPFYYTYDLQSGDMKRSGRGLWGTTFSQLNDNSTSVRRRSGKSNDNSDSAEGMEITAFSPGSGEMLAVAGRGGYVHLVDWKSGTGQVIGSMKMGGGSGGGIKSLWWAPSEGQSVLGGGAGGDGRPHLAAMTADSEVYLWDVGERKCVRKWKDEGGFRGSGRVMTGSAGASGGWLAIGSSSGFVNVYGSDSFATPSSITSTFSTTTSPSFHTNPNPLKSLPHLTTPISTLTFSPSPSQILAVASKEKKDALRLIHLPSLTSFGNWPTTGTPLGHVTSIGFSAGSEYLAVGNTRGRVLLYHLRGFGV